MSYIPLHSNRECAGKEAHKNWSMVKSEKAAPIAGTALRATGPVPPMNSRQGTPSIHSCET